MTQAQYRDATYSLVVVVHAFTLGFLLTYGMDKWRGTKWLESMTFFVFACMTLIVTVLTAVMFILGWAGTNDVAKI